MNEILNNERGATSIEYGLMLVLVLVVCVAAVTALGLGVEGLFGLLQPF